MKHKGQNQDYRITEWVGEEEHVTGDRDFLKETPSLTSCLPPPRLEFLES